MNRYITFLFILIILSIAQPALAMKKLFVGGLSWDTTAADVVRLTESYGQILEVKVLYHGIGEVQTASAEVLYDNPQDANTAAVALNGEVIDGQPISAVPKEMLVVDSKVKDVVTSAGLLMNHATLQELNDKVHELINAAIVRARANGRAALRPADL